MIDCAGFFQDLKENGFHFYTGVPDSLLKDFCAFVAQNEPADRHIIAANEGSALAIAAGYHLATRKFPVVYLQNSGTGNLINPLLSLVAPEVYKIPVLFIIGWRGEPGVHDEPQHVKQGLVMESLLKAVDLPYTILAADTAEVSGLVQKVKRDMEETGRSHVLLVRKETFSKFKMKESDPQFEMSREEAISLVLEQLGSADRVVSTTGMISREVYEYRTKRNLDQSMDFLTVGSMGHSSQIALGLSLFTDRQVYCLDGDGAFIMHMGGVTTIGDRKPKNFHHVILNNGAHDSVGGQPTVALNIDMPKIAMASGYKKAWSVSSKAELQKILPEFKTSEGPVLLEIKVKKGNRADLGRPKTTPLQNKQSFVDRLNARD